MLTGLAELFAELQHPRALEVADSLLQNARLEVRLADDEVRFNPEAEALARELILVDAALAGGAVDVSRAAVLRLVKLAVACGVKFGAALLSLCPSVSNVLAAVVLSESEAEADRDMSAWLAEQGLKPLRPDELELEGEGGDRADDQR